MKKIKYEIYPEEVDDICRLGTIIIDLHNYVFSNDTNIKNEIDSQAANNFIFFVNKTKAIADRLMKAIMKDKENESK